MPSPSFSILSTIRSITHLSTAGGLNTPSQAVASAAANKTAKRYRKPVFRALWEMLLVVQFELSPREEKTHARCNTLLRISHADAMDYPDQDAIFDQSRRAITAVALVYTHPLSRSIKASNWASA
ncbi:hypothetical protein Trihar35433_9265 [Trichoderma harzianum]|nr:hypothetical protein Trihar35433_9265 [Trichoderma harzianum]